MIGPKLLACAEDIREELSGLAELKEGKVHFRPTNSGITMVSLLPGSPQLGKPRYRVERLLENFEEEFCKHCVERKPGRRTPEKELQSFLIGDAYRNDRWLDPLTGNADDDGRLSFITDELEFEALVGSSIPRRLDLLALRRSEDRIAPAVIELKSGREMIGSINQLEAYASLLMKDQLRIEELCTAILGETIRFTDPLEKWLVWPGERDGPDRREEKLGNRGIGVIQYVRSAEGFCFNVGRRPTT